MEIIITHRGEIIEIGPRPYVAMRGKTVVAYVVSAPDARLIAAAPGLLDALTELVAVPNKHRPDRVWEQARAAIRRATEGGK